MTRRFRYGIITAVVLTLALVTVLALALRPEEKALTPARSMEGDVTPALAGLETTEMLAQAQVFLASERPWRAARLMRNYLERVDTVPPEVILLAARAEAGWGAWPQVLTLLEKMPALAEHDHGIGLYLLGRARDQGGDARGAIEAYRSFLALTPPAGQLQQERSAAQLRLGLALVRAGNREEGQRELQALAQRAGGASVWLDVLTADALAHTGDTAAVRAAVASARTGVLGLRAWRARVAAARQAGDLASARAIANQARAWAETDGTRAEFLVAAGGAAIEMGDTAAGTDAFRSAVELRAASPHARAAADLLRQGKLDAADQLALARVYTAQGLHVESVEGYRTWLDSNLGTADERKKVRLELANALFYAERYDEVGPVLRPLANETAARFLLARAESHRDNAAEAARIYLALANQFAKTREGAYALYLAASTWDDEGDFRRARELYSRVVREYPGSDYMGFSMMRLAGIAFVEKDYPEAARIWDQYRARFPRGPHALQSTYWAGRARGELGDSSGALTLFRMVRDSAPDSYYAVLASERLGQAFWPIPMSGSPAQNPAATQLVASWMRGVDLLRNAGFPDEASGEADRIVATAGNDEPTLYALAEALAERGYSQRAIRIGLRLEGTGPPNPRLLRILFPFPYRTLITEEARGRDFDPFIAAALIRQESMFEARITSHVGARGLMQIMPATGQKLADAVGIDPWDAELLYHPEINVHLGTRYLAQHIQNYEGSLPSVFSAYNAGAHRVKWWSEFPEYGNDELFTERIPYSETRNYVKILTRNRALYRGLYSQPQ